MQPLSRTPIKLIPDSARNCLCLRRFSSSPPTLSLAGSVARHDAYVLLHTHAPPSEYPARSKSPLWRQLTLRARAWGGLVNFAWSPALPVHAGYRGLGDVAVFIYFGLVAVLCTAVTQAGELNLQAWIAAVATGLFACALLMANNIRDIPGDREVGKRTLAVRLGDRWARVVFTAELGLAFALHVFLLPQNPWFLLVLLAAPLAIMAARTVLGATERTALIPVLKQCGILNLVWSVLFLIAVVAHQSL